MAILTVSIHHQACPCSPTIKIIGSFIDPNIKIYPMADLARESLLGSVTAHIRDFLQLKTTENIELEARLGRICNDITGKRIAFDTPHPVVFGECMRGMRFESGVDEDFFVALKDRFLEFPIVKSTDSVSIFDQGIRVIDSGEGRVCQRKRKIKTITIYCPQNRFDVRISVSVEEGISEEAVCGAGPGTDDTTDEESASSEAGAKRTRTMRAPRYRRERERESFAVKDYAFEFTKAKNMSGKKRGSELTVHEVEMEVRDFAYNKEEFIAMALNLGIDERSPVNSSI